jgi:molecular chaperone DnaK (HSP70)
MSFDNQDYGHSTEQFSPFESHADLVIAIDFGTTYSGVAYAHSGKVKTTSPRERSRIADKIVVVKAWPGSNNREKIPTLLCYNANPPTWGVKVKLGDEPRVAHFKLGLQENIGEHYGSRNPSEGQAENPSSLLGGFLYDHNWRHPKLPDKQPVDYAADYLTNLVQYVLTETLPKHFGRQFLQKQQISYIITVPAIWKDKAQELTRQAAQRAGISRRKLMLISEPEAAAVYCSTLCKEVDLQAGDRFLICDAGGGTVVRRLHLLMTKHRISSLTLYFVRNLFFLSRNVMLGREPRMHPSILTKDSKCSFEINLDQKPILS